MIFDAFFDIVVVLFSIVYVTGVFSETSSIGEFNGVFWSITVGISFTIVLFVNTIFTVVYIDSLCTPKLFVKFEFVMFNVAMLYIADPFCIALLFVVWCG